MNTHGTPDMMVELDGTLGDLLPACVVSNTPPAVPASGLTLSAFATRAYVRAGTYLTYVDQPAISVTLTGSDGTYWLAITDDTFSAFAGWSRRPGSHYMWRLSATRPADVDNLLVFSQLTVSGGNITTVSTPWGVAPPLALATADKVSLGGHAPTGVLDVQGSVMASDVANFYPSVRVWPVAPAGATAVHPVRVEAMTGAASSTVAMHGITVVDQPASSATVRGVDSGISAGTNRYNFIASGTAQNYFAGNVGIANSTPTYPLDVTGDIRFQGKLGMQTTPSAANVLNMRFAKLSQYGIWIQPTDSDTGNPPILFANGGGGAVGSISTTASATAFNTTSDGRLKHAVQALEGALGRIQALRPVRFRWNATGEEGEGFVAQDVLPVVPLAVTGTPDDPAMAMQLDFSKLVPHLVGACQELAAQIQTLTVRLARLEAPASAP